MLCSDSPACCELIQKIVQDRRKERGQDQSQDPNGFGVSGAVLEMTIKLVNRITLVTAHIVRATTIRMIICFIIFLFQLATFRRPNRSPICVTDLALSTK